MPQPDDAPIFTPHLLGELQLKNRVVMASVTRGRAHNGELEPTQLHVEYYRQRATVGLIFTEGTWISPLAIGFTNAPGPVAALEIEYSSGTRFIEKEILPSIKELGIGLVAYGVVGQGLLTGSIRNELPSNDIRRQFPKFDQENLPKNLEKISLLERMAREKNCTAALLAIAWVLSKGEDVVPLVRMSQRARYSR
jgi:hypothetical protein